MPATKTETMNLRVDPRVKEAARVAAKRDHRSVANLIEILIYKHCEKVGISIPEQGDIFDDPRDD